MNGIGVIGIHPFRSLHIGCDDVGEAVANGNQQRCCEADADAERVEQTPRLWSIAVFEEKAEPGKQADEHAYQQEYDESFQEHGVARRRV